MDLVNQNALLSKENNTLKNLVLEKFNKAEILALEEENLAGPNYWSIPAKIIREIVSPKREI